MKEDKVDALSPQKQERILCFLASLRKTELKIILYKEKDTTFSVIFNLERPPHFFPRPRPTQSRRREGKGEAAIP